MAFLKGSQIRPELARADFSAIERGGAARGNAYASIGANLAQGIDTAAKQYRKKKADKEQLDAAVSVLERMGYPPDEALAVAKAVGAQNIGSYMRNLQEMKQRFAMEKEVYDQKIAAGGTFKTQEDATKAAIAAAEESGGKLSIGSISQNGPGGTWTYSLRGVGDDDDPASITVDKYRQGEMGKLKGLLENGNDTDAMILADRLGLTDASGLAFQNADALRDRYGITTTTDEGDDPTTDPEDAKPDKGVNPEDEDWDLPPELTPDIALDSTAFFPHKSPSYNDINKPKEKKKKKRDSKVGSYAFGGGRG